MKKVVILHVFTDDKFFDSVSSFFDSLKNVENVYVFYSKDLNYIIQYINGISKIVLISDINKYKEYFCNSSIDIVYFHSLSPLFYKLFRYIDLKKKIIWWCWGKELYHPFAFRSALIKCNLYKPQTQALRSTIFLKMRRFFANIYHAIYYYDYFFFRNRIINRIDYFSPVLPIEYQLIKETCPFFRAKPFMLESGPEMISVTPFEYKGKVANILIGNSLTYPNNHLDVIKIVNECRIEWSRKIYIPINYGNDYKKQKSILKSKANCTLNYIWVTEFLPPLRYFELLASVSHAIFGVIRQQAMGNIDFCLKNGVKIFLFQDSIVYKELIDQGYKVFSIEDDLTTDNLDLPLSKSDAYWNYSLYYKNRQNREYMAESEILNIVEEVI